MNVKPSPHLLQEIFDLLDTDRELMLETLERLVQVPSVVGEEGPAQEVVLDLYRELDLEMDVFEATEIPDLYSHPAYCGLELPPETRYRGRPNVVATLPGVGDGRSLILNGHIDVVSPEPVQAWSVPPWGAVVKDGRMYGRGAGDMKAGLVAAWAALRAILRSGHRPRGTVKLQSVIEEEAGGGGGALACFLRGHTADGFLAVDPSGGGVRIGNGGILYFRVRVEGRTAHAGNAHLGVNAIAEMAPVVEALFELDRERAERNAHPMFEQGSRGRSCHLSLGRYRAGDWPSTVAGWAELECRIGFLPGEEREEVQAEVEEAVADAAATREWLRENPPRVEWFGWKADPHLEDPDDPFVQAVRQTAGDITGQDVPVYARTSGVDSRFAHLFGGTGVCYGPRAANVHGIDEYVVIESMFSCSRVLAALVLNWCG